LKARLAVVYGVASHDVISRLTNQIKLAMRTDKGYKAALDYVRGLKRADRDANAFDVPVARLASPADVDVRRRGRRRFALVH
jgi:hypothetical protein